MTVTGCLQAGSTPDTFVLNNVGETGETGWNQPGQAPSAMARSESNSYTLIPGTSINLQNWVGQRVQVTGKMKHETRDSASPSSSSPGSTTSSESSSTSGMTEMTVTSVKKASGTCQ